MAFVSSSGSPDQGANSDQDKEKQDQAPITSAPAGGGAGKPSGQASSTGPSQPFTNLSAYLGANGPQVQQMGSNIAGELTNDYANTNNSINSAKDSYSAAVKGGYTPYDQSLIDSFNTDPNAVANDPTKSASFKGMANDRYTGPGNFQDTTGYADATGKVQRSTAFANQVGTIPGLQSYLSSKSPTYTQGQGTLDSALLQTNPDAVKTVTDAATPFKNLPGYLDQATTAGNQASAQAVAEAQKAKDAASTAFNTNATGFNQSIDQKLQDSVKNATTFNTNYNDIIQRLSHTMPQGMDNGIQGLSQEELAGLGINMDALNKYGQANQVLNMYGNAPGPVNQLLNEMGAPTPMPLNSYLHGGNTANLPTDASNVASADDYNLAKSLAALGGDAYQSPLNPANAGAAGTYNPGGKYQTFDTTAANGLFDQISARDKALANNLFKTNANLAPGDYKGALDAIQKGLAIDPTMGSGAQYMLSALDRLANGFSAPHDIEYTPPAPGPVLQPPTIGGGNPGRPGVFY